jgi:hypothetical protein
MSKRRRRSDYRHVLALARKARRRGDALAAERWLKQTDRLLAADTYAAALVQAERKQAAERQEERAFQRQGQEAMRAHLQSVLDQIERSADDALEASEESDECECDDGPVDYT